MHFKLVTVKLRSLESSAHSNPIVNGTALIRGRRLLEKIRYFKKLKIVFFADVRMIFVHLITVTLKQSRKFIKMTNFVLESNHYQNISTYQKFKFLDKNCQ